MNQSDYSSFDGLGLSAGIKNGDFTIGEIFEAAVNTIESLNPMLNAVVIKNYENARRSILTSSGALIGVPFLIKDVNVFTHDMPTTFSCRFFDNADPRPDSEIVKRWRRSGLIVLGKSNTSEFAEDYVCEPTFRGATLNPRNRNLTTGGSSGGAASVPVINEDDHIPCAVQLAGHLGQDHRILQLSALIERLNPWQTYRPPIWAGNL